MQHALSHLWAKSSSFKNFVEKIPKVLAPLRSLCRILSCPYNCLELIQAKRSYQVNERRSKEERAKQLEELNSLKGKLGMEKGRNDVVEKVGAFCHLHSSLNFHSIIDCFNTSITIRFSQITASLHYIARNKDCGISNQSQE